MTVAARKRCDRCGEVKPLAAFYKHAGMADGYRRECRSCIAVARKQAYALNPGKARARVRQWEIDNPGKVAERIERLKGSPERAAANRRSHLRRKFALTEQQYLAMVEAQQGVCAICRQPPKAGTNLDVDHDHQTGKVRGLLCRQCNHALGLLDDDAGTVLAAASYLRAAGR